MGATLSTFRHFVDQSFWIPDPELTEKTLPDQNGKVFFITGANSGVGFELTKILYSRHARIYMGCRSPERANAAIEEIKLAHPESKGSLVFLQLDLADLSTIKRSVNEFTSKETRLDWLNHNAAVSMPPKSIRTAQGHDMQLGTNILGPFLLTKLLLPILQQTAQSSGTSRNSVRVSWAASIVIEPGAQRNGFEFDEQTGNPLEYTGLNDNYAVSKIANFWLAHEFGRRTEVVLHNSYNPGNLKTNLLRHLEEMIGGALVTKIVGLVLWHSRYGAYTELYAGLSPDLSLDKHQAGYIIPWGRILDQAELKKELVSNIGPERNSGKLWDWCEKETQAFT